jgi:hypothetical protein
VIADAGFSGFNDFPDSPTTLGNPTSITVAASCVHVQQDDIGAKLAVVRGVTVASTDPFVVVGTPILALYVQDEDGNDSQAATFAVSGTGCSLANAQNAQYLSPPFPAGLSDNLQTLLEPIMSGNITAK